MAKLWAGITATWLVVALAEPAAADLRTVTGEVVELDCSLSQGKADRGEAHAACAMSCARRGNQMAILTADAVYLVDGDYAANRNAKLLDFVARQVEAKGTITDQAGSLRINVASMAVAK